MKEFIQHLFTTKGTVSRLSFFKATMIFYLVTLIPQTSILIPIIIIITFISFSTFNIRRLKDMNLSGKWFFVMLIVFLALQAISYQYRQSAYEYNNLYINAVEMQKQKENDQIIPGANTNTNLNVAAFRQRANEYVKQQQYINNLKSLSMEKIQTAKNFRIAGTAVATIFSICLCIIPTRIKKDTQGEIS